MKIKSFLAGVALASGTLFSTVGQAADMQFFRIGSGSAGGAYFPIAGLIANAISNPPGSRPCDQGGSCGVPGLVAIAQSSNASVANATAIQTGQMESGLAIADIVDSAYKGEGKFAAKGNYDNLRVIANLFPEELHLVLPKGSDIKSINDLKGKKVGIAQAGSGTQVVVLEMLKAFGIDRSNIREAELNNTQSAEHLADGQLDAYFYIVGAPAAAIVQLASTKGMELYSFKKDELAKISEAIPYYYSTTISADTYEGLEKDITTLAGGAQWMVSSKVSDELVYDITKALWNDSTEKLFSNGHPKASLIKAETALSGLTIPLHPGAKRYYQEAGLIK
ncbi:C4-dicarboxylate ABC transporter substrate-binding protein [Endozoicomonas sp. OPT23]|uniref:TAXI family TRAP transporter solute-binding subunit n=1 Tax=Endozoicomonas sp. OPT23 TaxID=2072845 RepID=UPI00129ABCFA|nr:TAXI family TRAP transporter solute-binding subunit [Endozoicomonas sp. OPT23]MRI32641.1 C4-dicarboxylate ABC transporter substrate-binding protein [Endozoicomonas sp. OPT23]